MTTEPDGVSNLLEATKAAFEAVYVRSFKGDAVANPRLRVETLEEAVMVGYPTVVLITPWTLNGLIFPPAPGSSAESTAARSLWDSGFPEWLQIAGQQRAVFLGDLPQIGAYRSVNLVPDVSRLTKPEQARTLATSFVAPFHEALTTALMR